MGVFNIIFTEEEKEKFLAELLEKLKSGENRTTHLAEEIGVSEKTINTLKKRLIDER